jgi:RNA polymerase sigma-70 factor (ECF subfamily)
VTEIVAGRQPVPQAQEQIGSPIIGVVERIEHGDRAAEAELVARYARGVRLILLKRTGDAQVASDLCQDTFFVVIRKLRARELRDPAKLAAFVNQVAVNLSIEHFRRESRFVHSPDGIIGLEAAHTDKYDKQVDFEAASAQLNGVLRQLAIDRDREILRRYYLSDDDKDVICRDLDLSPTHFDRVLYRAKQRMRELIDRHEELKALLFGGLLDD